VHLKYNNREILSNSTCVTTIPELCNQEVDSNSTFCGFFLQWFHEIFVLNKGLPVFTEVFKEKLLLDKDIKQDKILIYKLTSYVKLWKQKFIAFLGVFMYNSKISALLHPTNPFETKVDDEPDGFLFIVESLAKTIFNKVFYSVSILKELRFSSNITNRLYHEDIILFTEEGSYNI
jgi:hypothetical protein